MNCGMEPIQREQIIAKYLSRSLDSEAVEEFEGHYLGCDECFDELRVSEKMASDLRRSQPRMETGNGVPCCSSARPRSLRIRHRNWKNSGAKCWSKAIRA